VDGLASNEPAHFCFWEWKTTGQTIKAVHPTRTNGIVSPFAKQIAEMNSHLDMLDPVDHTNEDSSSIRMRGDKITSVVKLSSGYCSALSRAMVMAIEV